MQLSCQRAERPVVAICSTGFWWGVECARETSLKLGGGGDRCLRLGHLSSLGKETFLTMLWLQRWGETSDGGEKRSSSWEKSCLKPDIAQGPTEDEDRSPASLNQPCPSVCGALESWWGRRKAGGHHTVSILRLFQTPASPPRQIFLSSLLNGSLLLMRSPRGEECLKTDTAEFHDCQAGPL